MNIEMIDSKIPEGPLKDKWTSHKSKINLVNPANKRLIDVILSLIWSSVDLGNGGMAARYSVSFDSVSFELC